MEIINPNESNQDAEDAGAQESENGGIDDVAEALVSLQFITVNVAKISLKESLKVLREIIGKECRGPFEKQLTKTEVEKNLLQITKSEYDEFIQPFLTEDGQKLVNGQGFTMILYGNQEDLKEMYMILKNGESDDDSHGMYVLIGDERWKRFCKSRESVIKVDEFVKIWIFRRANHILCAAITPGRTELRSDPSSKMIIKEKQDPPSEDRDIIGEWRGPFSKKLTNSDVKHGVLTILTEHSRAFIEPLLENNDCDLKKRVPVTMYINKAANGNENFPMKLKVRESGQHILIGGWKEFCQKHETMIKVDEFVTLWMFWHKKDKKLCSIITSGRVVEKYSLHEFPPVASLKSLIGECSEPFVRKLTGTDVNPGQDRLLISKTNFRTYLKPFLHEEERKTDSIPVTVYDADGDDFPMNFRKRRSEERALSRGWITFCEKHNPNKDERFAIWMFRNNRDQKLCFLIIRAGSIPNAEAKPAPIQR